MPSGYVYPGRVVRIDPAGPMVQVPLLGGAALWGPLPTSVSDLAVGEQVICASLGSSANTLHVIGRATGRPPSVQEIPGLSATLSSHNTRLDALTIAAETDQLVLADHETRLDANEALDVTQNGRLDAVEQKNTQQDGRLTATEGVANGAASGLATLRSDTAGRVDAKGDLLAGTANDTLARLPVGANGLALVADSAQTTGLAYVERRGVPLGLTGAVQPTRYVGGTTSGAPTSGTFAQGDFVISANGHVWVCTVAGTPGTWVSHTDGLAARMVAQEARVVQTYGFSPAQLGNNNKVKATAYTTHPVVGGSAIATLSNGDFLLNRVGRWAISMWSSLDHPVNGYFQTELFWPNGGYRPLDSFLDSDHRQEGYAACGLSWTNIHWSGWVDATAAAAPFGYYLYQTNRLGELVTNLNYYVSLSYMGGA